MLNSQSLNFAESLCLLVEDQRDAMIFLRAAVQSAFPGIKIIETQNLRETGEWLDTREKGSMKSPLGLCLIDLGLPDGSGTEVIRRITMTEPSARSVVVTGYDDDGYLFEALAAGASGYLLKREDPVFFVDILKRLQRGEPPLSPAIARRLLAHFHRPEAPMHKVELTPRERETLTLLARGLTVAEAANRMKLSALTVAGYVKIIYQKLHVTNRVEATREAIRRGLV